MPHVVAHSRALMHAIMPQSCNCHTIQQLTRTLLSPMLAHFVPCSLTHWCASHSHTSVPCSRVPIMPHTCMSTIPHAHAPIAPMLLWDVACATMHTIARVVPHCLHPCHSVRFVTTPQSTHQPFFVSALTTSTPICCQDSTQGPNPSHDRWPLWLTMVTVDHLVLKTMLPKEENERPGFCWK